MKERKREIQEKFKQELGLNVDKPKPGFGSSNDGNIARRFFDSSGVSAQIIGVEEPLIKMFGVML